MPGTIETLPTFSPEWSHEAVFAAERQSAGRVRGFVTSALIEHRLLRLVDPVRLAVDALVAVAIVHSHSPFTVTLASAGKVVDLTVEDTSPHTVARSVEALDVSRQRLAAFTRLELDCGVRVEPDGTKLVWATFA